MRRSKLVVDAIVTIAIGTWVFLAGLGKARVSKNPDANAAFLKRWGLVLRITGPAMIGVAVIRLVANR